MLAKYNTWIASVKVKDVIKVFVIQHFLAASGQILD